MSEYVSVNGLSGSMWGAIDSVTGGALSKATGQASTEQSKAIAQSTTAADQHARETTAKQQNTRKAHNKRDSRLTITAGDTGATRGRISKAPKVTLKPTPEGGVMAVPVDPAGMREMPTAAKVALGVGAAGLILLGIRALKR